MTVHARIFGRALLQVTLVAWNVVNVTHGDYEMAFISGCAISWVWWMNSRAAALSTARFGQAAYALGAGCGTVVGMVIGRIL